MKRFLAMLLSVLMLAGMLPLGVLAEEEAVAEEPAAVVEPVLAEESAAEEPEAEEPAAEEAAEEPAADEAAVEESEEELAAEEPAEEETVAEEPVAEESEEEPAAEESAVEEPAVEETVEEEPAAEEPAAEEPAQEEIFCEVKLLAEKDTYQVGDTVKLQAVYLVNGEKAEASFVWYTVNEKDEKEVIPEETGAEYTFEAEKAGAFRFAVSAEEECSKILTVVVEEPAVEEPVEEIPAAEEPATEEPAAEEAVTEEPVEEEAVTEEPATEEVVAEEPAAEEVATEEPASEEPAAEEAVTEETAAEEAVTEETAAEEAVTEETAAEEAVTEETAAEEAVAEEPAAEEAVTEETVSEETAAEEAVTEETASEETVSEEIAAEEELAEGELLAGDTELLAIPVPVIEDATFSAFDPCTIGAITNIAVTSIIFSEETDTEAITKIKFDWYKSTASATVKLKTTYETYPLSIAAVCEVQPFYSDNSAEYYCVITAYNAGGASAEFATATASGTVDPSCDTANLGSAPGTSELTSVIKDADGAAITIHVTNTVTLKSRLSVPSNVTIAVENGGELIVSSSGGSLSNNGALKVYDGGLFSCSNANSYSGTRIWVESADATISPTSLPFGYDGVTIDTISGLTIGTKVENTEAPYGYKYVAAVGIPAPLSCTYAPLTAWDLGLTVNSSIEGDISSSYDPEERTVTFTQAGTHTVTVTTPSGDSASFTVTVSNYQIYVYDDNAEHQHELSAGDQMVITVKLLPGNVTGTALVTPALSTEDQQYASLTWTGSGDTYTVTLTAKNITEAHTVNVLLRTEDEKQTVRYEGYPYYAVNITPTPLSVRAIWEDGSEDGVDVTGETLYYDIDDTEFAGFDIVGSVLPEDADQTVTWTYTDSNQTANVSAIKNGLHISTSGKEREGSVVLTGTSSSGATVSVTVRMVHLDTSIKIDLPNAPEEEYLRVTAGSSLPCTATLGTSLVGTVKWSMDSSMASWGTMKESTGVFTANKYAQSQGDVAEVEIYATLYVNKKAVASDSAIVKVVPAAEKAYIKFENELKTSGSTLSLDYGDEDSNQANSWTLTGFFTPGSFTDEDIPELTGLWTTSDSGVVSVKPQTDNPNKCTITAESLGTATITFTADDGSGVKTSIKVTISHQISNIELYSDSAHIGQQSELVSGGKLQLYAVVSPANATSLKLSYSVINCDSSFNENEDDTGVYATVSSSGKVTAKTVYSDHYVLIRVTSTDGGGYHTDYKLKIVPKTEGNLIIMDEDGYDVTGRTLVYDYLSVSSMQLKVKDYEDVTFTSNNSRVYIDPETGILNYTGTSLSKAFTVTITARDNNTPLRTATVKVTVTKLVQPGSITVTSKTGKTAVAAGLKLTLVKTVSSAAFNKNVTWSIDNGSEFATISSKGVLTAKKTVTAQTTVTVKATAKDGSGVSGSLQVTLYPKASYVLIEDLDLDEVVSGKTITMDYTESTANLHASVLTADAMQSVTWKSSNTKLATVTSDGEVSFKNKTGTVTITATAADGSKKYAKVTYKIVAMVDEFELNLTNLNTKDGNLAVRSGSTTQLKVTFIYPKKPTNQKMYWLIEKAEDQAYATITTAGKLKAASVSGAHAIEVTAVPYDNIPYEDIEETNKQTFTVWILPAVSGISIGYLNGEKFVNMTGTTTTISLSAITEMDLVTRIFPTGASENVTWKSSSTKIAKVTQDGHVTLTGKTGTFTIYVTAKDGSKKTSKIIFKVTK